MTWHQTRPVIVPPADRTWHADRLDVPDQDTQTGWWAVLGLDKALSVHWVTTLELHALKHLGLVQAVTVSRQLALVAIYTLAASRSVTVTRNMALRGTFQLDAALSTAVQRALALSRVTGIDLAQTLSASKVLNLQTVRTIDLTASISVGKSLTLARFVPVGFTATVTANRSLTAQRISLIDGIQPQSVNRTLGIGFPANAPVAHEFATAGPYTYTIPRWANYIDAALLGGGGGGGNGSLYLAGGGGFGGKWVVGTLVRGSTLLPWSDTSITGSVGGGGAGGSASGGANNGQYGGNTTATGQTYGLLGTGAGGDPGIGWSQQDRRGQPPNPQTQTHNGRDYTGGGYTSSDFQAGIAPGGGGASGPGTPFGNRAGAAGARGQAWFYAYQ